jgi:hypothetical protein
MSVQLDFKFIHSLIKDYKASNVEIIGSASIPGYSHPNDIDVLILVPSKPSKETVEVDGKKYSLADKPDIIYQDTGTVKYTGSLYDKPAELIFTDDLTLYNDWIKANEIVKFLRIETKEIRKKIFRFIVLGQKLTE